MRLYDRRKFDSLSLIRFRFIWREVVMPDQCGNFSGWQECSRMAVKIRSVSTAEIYRIIRLHADEEVGTSGMLLFRWPEDR
jgi:hypothetical protein